MNYRLIIGGYRFKALDECIKLLMYSADESDYITRVVGRKPSTPFSPQTCELFLTGSSKKVYEDIILDFDGLYSKETESIAITPDILGLTAAPDAIHYWGVLGGLFKLINDISPAYVKGYLIEENRKKELEIFTQFSNQLPFALQVAVNETMKDVD